jgi:hypothetical protein
MLSQGLSRSYNNVLLVNEIHLIMSKLEHLISDGKLNRTEIQFISLNSKELLS